MTSRTKKSAHASEQDRADVLKRRRRWFDGQLDLDRLKLVFVDETSAMTNMARWNGRCRRGLRLRCGVPHGHYKAITFVFGLRLRGVVTPKAYDRAVNAETFDAWLVEHLLPLLPLDDCLYGLQPTIPHLTRSPPATGISRLPEVEGDKQKAQRFAD